MVHPTAIRRYQVVERIGQGGMGTVYLARDPLLDRLLAIKLLRADLDSEQLRERFFREARAAGRLSHPNIVAVFDVGEHEGQPFIAMEFVKGETLRELAARRAELPLARRLRYMQDLCAGLAHAHACGIIHRDIKPANLIITPNDLLKILDFGIARVRDSNATEIGALMGSVSYMSPEQSLGLAVDHRADVFSVGAVFYELLSYHKAFPGQIEDGVLHRIQSEAPVPLDTLVAGLSPRLIGIVAKALEKDRNRRYGDLEAMRRDIASVLEGIAAEGREDSTRILLPGPPLHDAAAAGPATPSPHGTPRRSGDRSVFARRRAAEIESRLLSARTALARGDLEAAISGGEEALFLDPDNAEADEIRERARELVLAREVDRMIAEAREAVDRGALTAAGIILDRLADLDPAAPAAAEIRREIEHVRMDREHARRRQAAIEDGLEQARLALEQGLFAEAVAAADRVLALEPTSTAAATARQRALSAIDQAHRKEEHDRAAAAAVVTATQQFESGDHAGALALLAAFRPPHDVVSQAVVGLADRAKRVEEEHRQREQERAERAQRLGALAAAARRALREGGFEAALALAGEMHRVDGSSVEAEEIRRQAEAGLEAARSREAHRVAAEAAVAAARRQFEAGEHTESLAALAAFRPPHDLVTQAAAALAQRLKEIDAERRRAERRRVEREHQLLALVGQARTAMSRGLYDQALAAAEQLRQLDPASPHADTLATEAREGLAALASRDAHDRSAREAVDAARAHFSAGDRARALALLADFRPPHDLVSVTLIELGQLAQRLDEQQRQAVREEMEAERRLLALVVTARTAMADGRLHDALDIVRQMRDIDPASSAASALALQLQTEAARRELERDATVPCPPPRVERQADVPTRLPQPPAAVTTDAAATAPLSAATASPAPASRGHGDAPQHQHADNRLVIPAGDPDDGSPLETPGRTRDGWFSGRWAAAAGVVLAVTALLVIGLGSRRGRPAGSAPVAPPASAPNVAAPSPGSGPGGAAKPEPPDGRAKRAPAVDNTAAAGSLVGIALDELSHGNRDAALSAAERGLQMDPGDRRLTGILERLETAAREEVAAARRRSLAAGADLSPSFQQANGILRSPIRRSRQETIRDYWEASRLFDQATAAARVAGPEPVEGAGRSRSVAPPSQPLSSAPTRSAGGESEVHDPVRLLSTEDEQAIRVLLTRWKMAMEGTSTAELKTLQDNLTPAQISGIESFFLNYPSRTIDLKVLVISSANRDVATVRCAVARTMRPANAREAERHVSEAVTFRLERRNAWTIVEVRGLKISADR